MRSSNLEISRFCLIKSETLLSKDSLFLAEKGSKKALSPLALNSDLCGSCSRRSEWQFPASKMTWPLAPPYPKELTPAHGIMVVGQLRLVLTISIFLSLVLSSGFTSFTPMVAGMTLFSRAKTTLMMLEIPLTASLCPMFVFKEPIRIGRLESCGKTRDSTSTSTGSPIGVPVP